MRNHRIYYQYFRIKEICLLLIQLNSLWITHQSLLYQCLMIILAWMEVSLSYLVTATSSTSQTMDDPLSTLHHHVQVALKHLLSVIFLVDLVTWVKTSSTENYLWKIRIFINNGLKQLHSVLISKRRKSSNHLMD